MKKFFRSHLKEILPTLSAAAILGVVEWWVEGGWIWKALTFELTVPVWGLLGLLVVILLVIREQGRRSRDEKPTGSGPAKTEFSDLSEREQDTLGGVVWFLGNFPGQRPHVDDLVAHLGGNELRVRHYLDSLQSRGLVRYFSAKGTWNVTTEGRAMVVEEDLDLEPEDEDYGGLDG